MKWLKHRGRERAGKGEYKARRGMDGQMTAELRKELVDTAVNF